MGDDFGQYDTMRGTGASPAEVYRAARADGLGEIARIRLLRKLFGLSLADAKKVALEATGTPDPFDSPQEVRVGGKVYWEGGSRDEGPYLMEARVTRLDGDQVFVEGLRKYRITPSGLEEVPVQG